MTARPRHRGPRAPEDMLQALTSQPAVGRRQPCKDIPAMTTSQMGRPVGADGEKTRRRIITAAMHCVARNGYSETTIRQIAGAANMTSAALYNYFPNKSELIAATIAARADIALPRLRGAAQRPGDVVDRLDAVLDESGQLMREYPDLAAFEWAIRAENALEVQPAEAGGAGSQAGLQAMRDIIKGIIDDAYPPDDRGRRNARAAIDAVYALIYGLTELAATTSPETYHRTLKAAKQLIRGTLFDQLRRTRE